MNKLQRKTQAGFSLTQLILIAAVAGVFALIAMKLAPEYIEYFKIKSDVKAIAQEVGGNPNATVADVRRSFDRRAEINQIKNFSSADLDVSKEGNQIVIAFEYQRKVHMFSNISVLIDFEGSSAK